MRMRIFIDALIAPVHLPRLPFQAIVVIVILVVTTAVAAAATSTCSQPLEDVYQTPRS
jgi:hypothetical protein